MPENASLSVEFQTFLAIGKDGLGSPSLGPGSAVREKGKKPVERAKNTRQVWWATHWTGEGEREAEPGDMPLMLPPFHLNTPDSDIMLWLVKCFNVDKFAVLLTDKISHSFNTGICQLCFQTRISSKQNKFLCETFHISLGSKKSKKYVYGLLQKKKALKISSFLHSPVINTYYGQVYKAIEPWIRHSKYTASSS